MLKRILFLSLCLAFSFSPATAQKEDLAPLLAKIKKRLNSYSNNDWTYKITTKTYEMDKEWQPDKTTIATAVIKDAGGILSGELLKAEEIEDGITKDVTAKSAEQTKKQIETANKRRAERDDQERSDDSLEALLPFNEGKIERYDFIRLDDAVIDGRAVFKIAAKAKEMDKQLFEGNFYIDKLTYDVLKAQLKPSKNPTFVKELDMDIDFEVLPEGKFYRKRSRTRANGGMLFKHFRVIVEEEYSDVKVLDSKAN